MTVWEKVRRAGSLLLILSLGALAEEPLRSGWTGNPVTLAVLLPLYGLPAVLGVLEILVGVKSLEMDFLSGPLSRFSALLADLWLLLWCFVWLALIPQRFADPAASLKHLGYLHLFGVGFALAGTALSYRFQGDARTRVCLSVGGWVAAYASFIHLSFLEPGIRSHWAAVVGGLLWVLTNWKMVKQS